jgi:N utilization substance protein B
MSDPARNSPRPGARSRAQKRSAARLAAVQALYQMDIARTDVGDVLAEYEALRIGRELEGEQYREADRGFFRDIVSGVVREQRMLDPRIDQILKAGWPLARLDAIVRAVLRAGAYEIAFRSDVPPKVVITEYVDVAKAFFEGDETRLINGVLDRLAHELRPDDLG